MKLKQQLLIYLLISTIAFSYSKGYAQKYNCKLFEQGIDITSNNFPAFKKELDEFKSGKYSYDLIYIKLVGGNAQKSQIKRVFYVEDKWCYISRMIESDSVACEPIVVSKDLIDMFEIMDKGEYFVLCSSYDSSNESYIYLVRSNEQNVFKLLSPVKHYNLNESDLKQIANVVKLFYKLKL